MYKALQELYYQYSVQGLQILAFPSSQFTGVKDLRFESDQIREWACKTHKVSFPIFEQAVVAGEDADPLF